MQIVLLYDISGFAAALECIDSFHYFVWPTCEFTSAMQSEEFRSTTVSALLGKMAYSGPQNAYHLLVYPRIQGDKKTDAFHIQIGGELIAGIKQFPCVQPTGRGYSCTITMHYNSHTSEVNLCFRIIHSSLI